jgi:UDP-GlcNAc3NAcA epimerase
MKIISILGARPQFIKASPLLNAIRRQGHDCKIVHTGQHYDDNMSQVFFDEMNIPTPDVNLGMGTGSATQQVSQMMLGIDTYLREQRPDWVLVYGDTNSTLAGALAAMRLELPLAHIEAGLRSYNWSMPEEQNRVLTDRVSTLKFCPTEVSVQNLKKEGITKGVYCVGDTMYDALILNLELAKKRKSPIETYQIREKDYYLLTIHRASNTDDWSTLDRLLQTVSKLPDTILFPIHPRTRARLPKGYTLSKNIQLIDPLGYFDMIVAMKNAKMVLTDSGGIQKEAFFLGVPCVTLREETEWVETVSEGWNVIAGTNANTILTAIAKTDWPTEAPRPIYGDGHASEKILSAIEMS